MKQFIKTIKRKIYYTLAFIAISNFSIAQVSITLNSVADASISNTPGTENTNRGSVGTLETLGWTWSSVPGVYRSLVKFDTDQIPVGATIQSATLNLFGDPTHWVGSSPLSGANAGWIERVTNTWAEDSVTWNNQPTTSTTNRATIPTSTNRNQNYSIDVKQLVIDMLANGDEGLMIKLQNDDYYRSLVFGSRENPNSAIRPTLVITYNCSFTVNPITGDSSVCAGQYLPLTNTTAGGTWTSSNPSIATVNNGWITGVSAGTTIISYSVTVDGCTQIVTKSITVNDKLSFIIVGPSTLCPNSSGNSYTVSPIVTGADYTWNIQDGPNVGVNFPVNGSTNTTLTTPTSVTNNQFTLRAQGLNACGASQIVTKLINLSTDIPLNPDVQCSTSDCLGLYVTNFGSNSVKWIVNGVVQGTGSTFTRPDISAYVQCVYTSASGCQKSTWYSPKVVCTYSARQANTREDYSQPVGFRVFPNPNNGSFTLNTDGYNGHAIILNTLGTIIDKFEVNEGTLNYDIKMSNKPKGSYIIKLTGDSEDYISLFLVQ